MASIGLVTHLKLRVCTLVRVYSLIKFYSTDLGVKLKFELERSEDAFVIMKESTDNEMYKVKVLNISLLMPIAQLSQGVYDTYNRMLTKQIDNKPVGVSYRRIEIRPINIPRNTENFFSELLFRDISFPSFFVLPMSSGRDEVGVGVRSWRIGVLARPRLSVQVGRFSR